MPVSPGFSVRAALIPAVLLIAFCGSSAAGLNLVGEFSPIEGQVSFITFGEDYVFYAPDTELHVFHRDLTNTLFFKLSQDPERRGQTMARQYGDRIFLSAYGYHPDHDANGSLTIINISDPDNIYYEYTYVAGGTEPEDAILFGAYQRRGDILYMINQTQGFSAIDISEMGDFQTLDRITFDPRKSWDVVLRPRCVELYGNYAYVSDLHGGRIIDISDPYNLEEVGEFDTPGTVSFLHLDGKTLYVTDEQGAGRLVTAFDLSDPLTPLEIGHYSQPDLQLCSHGSANIGNYLFLLESQIYPWEYSSGIKVLDVSDWENPVVVDFYDTSDLGALFGDLGQNIGICDNLLYVGVWNRDNPANNQMLIFDVSEYAVPEPSTIFLMIGSASGLAAVAGIMRRKMR